MAWSYVVQFHNISEFHVHSGRCLTCASLSNKAKLAASTALLSPRAATWTELKVPWLRCSFKHQMGCIFLIWYLQYLYFLTTHKSKIKPKYHLSELVMMRLYIQDLCINKYIPIFVPIVCKVYIQYTPLQVEASFKTSAVFSPGLWQRLHSKTPG